MESRIANLESRMSSQSVPPYRYIGIGMPVLHRRAHGGAEGNRDPGLGEIRLSVRGKWMSGITVRVTYPS